MDECYYLYLYLHTYNTTRKLDMIEPDQIDLTLIVISAFYHMRVQHGAAITCTTLANLTHLYNACRELLHYSCIKFERRESLYSSKNSTRQYVLIRY